MIYDCFLFYDELLLLEVRLKTLADIVDKFVLVESTHTFSGHDKRLHYNMVKDEPPLAAYKDKIVHIIHDGVPSNNSINEVIDASLMVIHKAVMSSGFSISFSGYSVWQVISILYNYLFGCRR